MLFMFYEFFSTYILPYIFSADLLDTVLPLPLTDNVITIGTLLAACLTVIITILVVLPLVDLLSWLVCLPVRFFACYRRRIR